LLEEVVLGLGDGVLYAPHLGEHAPDLGIVGLALVDFGLEGVVDVGLLLRRGIFREMDHLDIIQDFMSLLDVLFGLKGVKGEC
jgi:hypothetical protein